MPLRKPKHEKGTALLVDGDNVPPDVLPAIIAHLEEDQPVTERRIYRNWRSTKDSQVWDRVSKEGAFERVDRYNTRREGKNASDIAVAVGAMDLFHDGYRSFCLVSGDTDFVPVIERLRRGGSTVTLIGHIEDPGLLEQVSDSYTPHARFGGAGTPARRRGKRSARRGGKAEPAKEEPKTGGRSGRGRRGQQAPKGGGNAGETKGQQPAKQGTPPKQDTRPPPKPRAPQDGRRGRGSGAAGPTREQKDGLEAFLQDVFDTATEEGRADDAGWILVDTLGKMVKQKDAAFQPSKFGYPNRTSLSDLFQICKDSFVVHSRPAKGGNRLVYRVRRR